jgi:hypothetical protein
LVCERAPRDPTWDALCASLEISLVSADNLAALDA